jgi:uncharacterized protein HemX
MKSLLVISATLMVGAGIFGFVDYKKKEQSKEFNALYKEEKPVVQQPSPEIVTSPVPVIAVAEEIIENTKSTVNKKTKKGKHKRIKYTQFSRAIPREALEEVEKEEPSSPVKKEE